MLEKLNIGGLGKRRIAEVAQKLRIGEDVPKHRGEQAAVVVLLPVGWKELGEIVQHAGEPGGVLAEMGLRRLARALLVMLDQVIPRVAKHIREPEEHDRHRLARHEIEQLALLVAHHDRPAVDQRDRGIRGQRDGALIHDGDFRRHLSP